MRIQVNGANVLEEYAYDGAQMVAAFGPNQSVVWSATWGPGLDNLISITRGDATFLALSDGRGSIGTYVNELTRRVAATSTTRRKAGGVEDLGRQRGAGR